jgi:hypothetical protein
VSDNTRTIEDLRARLFDAIDGVRAGTMGVDKARMVSEIAQVIVNTAKVEVEYLKATGGGESRFIDTAIGAGNLPPGITGIRQHRLKG